MNYYIDPRIYLWFQYKFKKKIEKNTLIVVKDRTFCKSYLK